MSIDRPTFHESWYRVSLLKPRLRGVVQVTRQEFRGRIWHVLRDPGNNQYYRLDEAAYRFVALLDGKRTVGEAWNLVGEQLGDRAPTQGEAIQLMGQLYTSNLLTAELPPDAEGMFDRYRRRVNRQVGGYLMNIMFARIPLVDPERMLNKWKGVVCWIFGPVGIALWLVLLFAGLWHLAGNGDKLFDQFQGVLDPTNLFYLYGSFVLAKVIHELGHAFAVKRFGTSERAPDEVHTIGVMLLVLMPVPYVDATSAWGFRNKWRRAFVGAAGMYVELALAAIAAIVWARTSENTVTHAIAYNTIFIAGVSTLLFNGNPLIRFDGYYILSDLTETPNLYQRANDYLKYLCKKFMYGVRNPRNPAHSTSEQWWLTAYGLSSLVYRIFLFAGILWFVADKLFFVGALMAIVSIIAWFVVPVGKWIRYIVTNGEVERTRGRTYATSFAAVAAVVVLVGLIPVPDHARAYGLVEPVHFEPVYIQSDGVIDAIADSGSAAAGATLVDGSNTALETELAKLTAQVKRLSAERRQALVENAAKAQGVSLQLAAAQQARDRVADQLDRLKLTGGEPEANGTAASQTTWVSPEADRSLGAFVRRGEPIGVVASLDDMIIRAAADQYTGPLLSSVEWIGADAEFKTTSQPEHTYTAEILKVSPAGLEELPSAALGFAAGGPIATDLRDPEGTKSVEQYFEIRLKPEPGAGLPPLAAGQRVEVRFAMGWKPIAEQGLLELQRLFQKRFGI